MSKRNKLRYQSKGNQFPAIALTGNVYLRFEDEEKIASAQRGDIMVFLSTDTISYNTHVGDYTASGFEGYLKADMYDGREWRPMSLEEFFTDREYFFGKRERPIDTYLLCAPLLRKYAGTKMMRTYREHYVMASENSENEPNSKG